MATLEATDLVKQYGKRTVVRNVSLSVDVGEIVGLLGRNGAGKSTTFKMIMGIIRANRGRIILNEHDVTKLALYKRARRGLGYLAQEPTIFQKLSVENNLRAILETTSLSKSDQGKRLDQLLEEFGLKRIRSSMAATCSGGERRRLEIARSLVTNPKIVLLDEPFAGVDPIAVEDIKQLVRGLVQRGIGVLLTDHNVREVLAMTDRSYIISDGQLLREGSPHDIVADPIVRKEYLGERFKLDRDEEQGFVVESQEA